MGRAPLNQALELLSCASPERLLEEWAALPFGQLCRGLFQLRALMFGPIMPGVVSCPSCGERLEFTFECQSVESAPGPPVEPLRIEYGERVIQMRLPTAGDLLAVRSSGELLSRCANQPVVPDQALIQAASERVAEVDPLSETLLDLVCASCGHPWHAFLDIASYLCSEVAHEVRRLLREVHKLASAYGWREDDILALSPARRRAYLELAGI